MAPDLQSLEGPTPGCCFVKPDTLNAQVEPPPALSILLEVVVGITAFKPSPSDPQDTDFGLLESASCTIRTLNFCSPNAIIHSINKHLFANCPFFEIMLYKISKYIFLVSPVCVQMHADILFIFFALHNLYNCRFSMAL